MGTVLRSELRQHRGYLLAWALSMAFAIWVLLPIYNGFLTGSSQANVLDTIGGPSSPVAAIGLSVEHLVTPVGMFGFLTIFLMLPLGIHGMHLGSTILAKDYREHTAEFLLTTPVGRSAVFWAKALTVWIGTTITGVAYGLAAYAAEIGDKGQAFDHREFWLVAGSAVLVTWVFAGVGLFVGARWPNLRSTLLVSAFVVFVSLCIGSFATIMHWRILT